MIRSTPRRSRRLRQCDSCLTRIPVGAGYLSHVASPNHGDLGNTHWWATTECGDCATRYGRGSLLGDLSFSCPNCGGAE